MRTRLSALLITLLVLGTSACAGDLGPSPWVLSHPNEYCVTLDVNPLNTRALLVPRSDPIWEGWHQVDINECNPNK